MSEKNLRWEEVISEAQKVCREAPKPFRHDAEMLEAARLLLEIRNVDSRYEVEGVDFRALLALEKRVAIYLHQSIGLSGEDLHLMKIFRQYKLTRIEKEILLVLALTALGMCRGIKDIDDVQTALHRKGKESLAVVQALTPASRLVSRNLVILEESEKPVGSEVSVTDRVLTGLVENKNFQEAWEVKTQEALLDRLFRLVQNLRDRAEYIQSQKCGTNWRSYRPRPSEEGEITRSIYRQFETFEKTARVHADWPINHLLNEKLPTNLKLILIALLGKELGFLQPSDELFTGDGLARSVSESVPETRHNLSHLRGDKPLRQQGFLRVCGGYGDAAAIEDEATLRTCEFELTHEFLEKIKVKRQRKESIKARKPVVKPEQLVLSSPIRMAMDMIVAQMRHKHVLLDDWGIKDVIPYGRAVTVLFSGPPGVGKTACAEAITHELNKSIILVNYAEIENCFVGQTEKNIVRAFREATDADAVLFWDEADAMFYDRDSAYRNWEVRDVNVLLMELERFEGLCILATNRKITLDKALERRLALKVEFELPDQAMRKEIWRRLIPAKMPLAEDVLLNSLSGVELSGGEIKNAVLNAARSALARDPKGQVSMADFEMAIQMEVKGRWSDRGRERIGFSA